MKCDRCGETFISIHALREEGDLLGHNAVAVLSDFYPRPPRGGRQSNLAFLYQASIFLSTPSARRATLTAICSGIMEKRFLSTPSARRATHGGLLGAGLSIDFYPRPPRGGRQKPLEIYTTDELFLSTPSARRATGDRRRGHQKHQDFYPRPPRGGRRRMLGASSEADYISIHALREEGDEFIDFILEALSNFYPRPPRGGRRHLCLDDLAPVEFLSTPSARRATVHKGHPRRSLSISIHALREEGDQCQRFGPPGLSDFYPRPPRGGRPTTFSKGRTRTMISIHALREEGDPVVPVYFTLSFTFLSTPSARRATAG